MSPKFTFVTPGASELPHSLFASEVAWFIACGVFVNDKANGGWFLFYCKLMQLWLMGAGFENTGIVLGKWNVSSVIPRLYGWIHKILRFSQLLVELWVSNQGYSQSAGSQSVVTIASSQLRGPQLESYGKASFRFLLYEICV